MSPPRLVVTLSARNVVEATREIEEARGAGADLAELRLDRWAEPDLDQIGGLFPSALPLVATYRSRAEGGEGATGVRPRATLLRRFRRLPFAYIDREVARDPAPPVRDRARSVGSRHLAAPVDWTAFAELRIRGRVDGELAKTVAPATVAEFLGHYLPELAGHRIERGPDVLHATGPSGALSRVWAWRAGSPWVFCAPASPPRVREEAIEPSQLPIDRVASVVQGRGGGPLLGLLGHPVRHSASPDLHHGWLRAERTAGVYLTIDVETERELRDLLPTLGPAGFLGLNVTAPWKRLARALADEEEPAAADAEAANCLTFRNGRWRAADTDVDALARRLGELRARGMWDGSGFDLVGSGGAARAALAAARRLGVPVRLWARHRPESNLLAHRFGELVRTSGRPAGRLVVHATSVGRASSGPLDPALHAAFAAASYCLDLVYRPDHNEIRTRTERAGGTYEDGENLLRLQAAESYLRWFDRWPPGEAPVADAP